MRLLSLLTLVMTSSAASAAVARESVTAQAARVHTLLQSLQVEPKTQRDLALSLRPAVVTSQKQLAREQLSVIARPVRRPSLDPAVMTIEGELHVLPIVEGQRSCEEIQQDWSALDRVYHEVTDLALELEEIYQYPPFCASCADTVLTTLKQATDELGGISARLNADGNRELMILWVPEAFLQHRETRVTALHWDRLIYYNVDGDSQLGDATHPLSPPPGLNIRSPLLQKGIQFQTEVTAERACSPGFEIRLDGLAKAMFPVERIGIGEVLIRPQIRSVPIKLILVSP